MKSTKKKLKQYGMQNNFNVTKIIDFIKDFSEGKTFKNVGFVHIIYLTLFMYCVPKFFQAMSLIVNRNFIMFNQTVANLIFLMTIKESYLWWENPKERFKEVDKDLSKMKSDVYLENALFYMFNICIHTWFVSLSDTLTSTFSFCYWIAISHHKLNYNDFNAKTVKIINYLELFFTFVTQYLHFYYDHNLIDLQYNVLTLAYIYGISQLQLFTVSWFVISLLGYHIIAHMLIQPVASSYGAMVIIAFVTFFDIDLNQKEGFLSLTVKRLLVTACYFSGLGLYFSNEMCIYLILCGSLLTLYINGRNDVINKTQGLTSGLLNGNMLGGIMKKFAT